MCVSHFAGHLRAAALAVVRPISASTMLANPRKCSQKGGSGSGSGDARRPAPSAARELSASRAPDEHVVRQGLSYAPHICLPAERCPHERRRARLIDEVQVCSVGRECAQRLQPARPPTVMLEPLVHIVASHVTGIGRSSWHTCPRHGEAPACPGEGWSGHRPSNRPLTEKPASRARSVGAGRSLCGSPQHARQATHLPAARGCHRRRAPIQIERVEDGAGARKHVDHLPTGSAKHATCN